MSTPENSPLSEKLFLDDMYIGQRFVSATNELDEKQVIDFARQFDPQSFHTDAKAASDSFFGQLVASGWHTAAISMRLMVQGGLPIQGGLIGAGGEISWPKPTLPNAVLHVESEVVDLKSSRSRPERGIATIRSQTLNQNGEVVQVFTGKLVVARRTQPS